ncbi:hypothetical protein ACIBO2_52425 [Nonomuraea sp. NPDC050022]|uniref:hypothetical protein n=1 Tax=unclassified Nonomuraea TaxID=2593643 RepID=UPI0033E1266E
MTPIAASESLATFEGLLTALLEIQTQGQDWRQYSWPPGTSTGVLRQALNSGLQLPAWRMVNSLLVQLGAPESSLPDFHAAYERAKLYRPWSDTIRISQDADHAGTGMYVIHNTGGTVNVQAERRYPRRTERLAEPVIQDAPGYDLKPDPFTANSVSELEELAREFWRWAGTPSTRQLAEQSRGAFSHATVAKIIYDKPGKPPLKMQYLLGLIRGCGGDAQEQQQWASAWRILNRTTATKRETRPALKVWTTRAG